MADILRVKDVASLLRLSADSIRFYEKRGIIHPKRQSDNQYRLFHMDDIRRLYDCKIFQNIGFTIADIEAITMHEPSEMMPERLDDREKQLEADILRSQMALYKIRKLRASSELVSEMQGQYLIQPSPHVLICFYAVSNHFNPDSVANPYFQTVMDYHNLFDCAVLIPKDEAHAPDVHRRGKFGFSIDLEALQQWSVPLDQPEREIPPRLCVYTAFASSGIVSSENLTGALEWMEKRNLELAGDVFCKMRQVVFEKGNDTRHYEIWLPIAEKV